jgi:uncharacterized protein (TIGR03435 family)
MKSAVKLKLIGTALAITAGLVRSQTGTPARPEFEVASVKPDNADSPVEFGAGNGGAGGRNVTLKMLIGFAWRLQEFQISGGPGWVGSDRFDVQGKAEDRNADPDRLRLMLQSLLEDRFNLKSHRETKESTVYELAVGKGGPKIKLNPDQTSPDVNGPAPLGAGPNRGAIRIGAGSLTGNAVTLARFTRFLSQRLDRTVVDKTNLAGSFDIQLQWTPDAGDNPFDPGGNALPPADSSRPSIFAAIQEQLGLKLESASAPVDVFVIDHVEKPSEN